MKSKTKSKSVDLDVTSMEQNASKAADHLKVLAHPVRLLILCHLNNGELSVHELEKAIGTSQSSMSQHLSKLRLSQLVEARKQANTVFYNIKNPEVMSIVSLLQKAFC